MKVKVIDFGYTNLPSRAHENDAGADVYSTKKCVVYPHTTEKIHWALALSFQMDMQRSYFRVVAYHQRESYANCHPLIQVTEARYMLLYLMYLISHIRYKRVTVLVS